MARTIHTIHEGNHEDHHSSVKNMAAALWKTKIPRRFTTSVIARPIKPSLSNAFVGFMGFGFGCKRGSRNDPKLSDCGGAAHRLRKDGWGRRWREQPV